MGAINLTQFVTSDRGIDLGKLKYVTEMAVRMLDNVVDLFDFPVERVNRVCRRNRRVGLGIMGFADMLYAMRVEYSSPAGRETARTVMGFINDTAHAYSEWLAIEKAAFPACEEAGIVPPRRNAALTSIAPTGTIAMMFGVSGGVEPRFALCYSKDNILGGESLQYDINAECLSALQEAGLATPDILADIRRTGKMGHIKAIPQGMCNVFVTAGEIEWQDHVRMQAAFQRYTDNAISKVRIRFAVTSLTLLRRPSTWTTQPRVTTSRMPIWRRGRWGSRAARCTGTSAARRRCSTCPTRAPSVLPLAFTPTCTTRRAVTAVRSVVTLVAVYKLQYSLSPSVPLSYN